jgi:hypothetical protein
MKRTLLFALLSMAAVAIADVVPTVQWDVETGRLIPAPYALSIRRGESANLEPRFLSYNTAMNLTGSVVQLRYWYTGQTGYYAATGSLMTATGRVHIAWYDALCPASNALNYEVRATLGTSVLARAYGPLSLLAGSSGTATNGQVYQAINWGLLDQTGGTAVLSNQLGSGATWTGSNWTFASSGTSENFGTNAAFLSVSNAAINAYPSSNPSNYVTATITNGLASTGYVAGVVSGYLPTSTVYVAAEADTPLSIWSRVFGFQNMQGVGVHYSNTLFKISGAGLDLLTVSGGLSYAINASADKETVYALARTEGPAGRFVAPTNTLVATATDGGRAIYAEGDIVATGTVTAAGFSGSGASLTGITAGQVGAVSNTAAGIAAVGGVTNRTYVTATPLDCSPTTTITRAMIDAAPWGEMSLALTQACYLVFDPTVTSGVDVATFRIWIKGTNSLTWTAVTNMLSSGSTAAWTNATATGSWRIFDKNPDGGLRVW